jgi:hypothetical protein
VRFCLINHSGRTRALGRSICSLPDGSTLYRDTSVLLECFPQLKRHVFNGKPIISDSTSAAICTEATNRIAVANQCCGQTPKELIRRGHGLLRLATH